MQTNGSTPNLQILVILGRITYKRSRQIIVTTGGNLCCVSDRCPGFYCTANGAHCLVVLVQLEIITAATCGTAANYAAVQISFLHQEFITISRCEAVLQALCIFCKDTISSDQDLSIGAHFIQCELKVRRKSHTLHGNYRSASQSNGSIVIGCVFANIQLTVYNHITNDVMGVSGDCQLAVDCAAGNGATTILVRGALDRNVTVDHTTGHGKCTSAGGIPVGGNDLITGTTGDLTTVHIKGIEVYLYIRNVIYTNDFGAVIQINVTAVAQQNIRGYVAGSILGISAANQIQCAVCICCFHVNGSTIELIGIVAAGNSAVAHDIQNAGITLNSSVCSSSDVMPIQVETSGSATARSSDKGFLSALVGNISSQVVVALIL